MLTVVEEQWEKQLDKQCEEEGWEKQLRRQRKEMERKHKERQRKKRHKEKKRREREAQKFGRAYLPSLEERGQKQVLAEGIAEEDGHRGGANAEDERGGEDLVEETCSEQAQQKKKKKEKEKEKKNKKRKKNEKEERSDGETHEDNQAQAEDPLKPLTDCSNAAVFIRESHVVLVEARGSNAGVFLDLCCGKGGVGKRAEAMHKKRAIRVDWASQDPAIIKCDLADPAIRTFIKKEIIDGKLSSVAAHLHVPCDTFTPARHGKPGGKTPVPLRDWGENVWGLPGLAPRDQVKLEQGNKIARSLLGIRDDLKNAGAPVGLENGDQSILFKVPEMGAEDADMLKVCYCMMGKPYRKRTRLLVWNAPSPRILKEEAHRCATQFSCSSPNGLCRRTGIPHLILRGWARGKALTEQGAKYPKKFVNMIARILCSPAAEPAA